MPACASRERNSINDAVAPSCAGLTRAPSLFETSIAKKMDFPVKPTHDDVAL